ncbi:hypothetical protein A2631_00300 [Candidatus Daviesbacteria bacterium RIFCSPHIGHO2_01_FULL_44_29]|uniref:Methyltransferase type 11 domain-containing protein n=1 Tax=Candidatus Daviesbacteria bacterium RIFCSPHIGHO2_02_FULL_43_12 TaxID=1797776 RepID=A0A1F5KFQ0_9BACT|nr:MAG: hypothetical protein A2631_00300 [Candidatus Daviesbacteria bacterium RIFCSPHIGHO2_01_FULL_44_29]OGE39773.1 MAG: hypothetical protein A3D25_03540 [Candidatus Daviesbacteria bacterium RIFCSPHIGHO2_02_FULL_43_12]OGE69936.1 MAG: hypothetical protein A3B55_04545 [Candidatus Daviesbacteria bacterium RIFCSPLOWO2_01_FULL_43_15]
MLIEEIALRNPQAYSRLQALDHTPEGTSYRVDRGISHALNEGYLPFNHFAHLSQATLQNPGRVIDVFEGGCGQGRASGDLKRGIKFRFDPTMLNKFEPSEVRAWRRSLDGQTLEGLGNAITTSGITLTQAHATEAQNTDPRFQMDKIVVGDLGTYSLTTPDRFDFIFDSFGVAFHRPLEAILAYSRILRDGGIGIMRVVDGFPEDLQTMVQLMQESCLRVLICGKPTNSGVPIAELLFTKEGGQ